MIEGPLRWWVAAAVAVVATVMVVVAVLLGANPSDSGTGGSGLPPSADVSAAGAIPISIDDRAVGRRVPPGYLGLSIEFQAVRAYTGPDPRAVNPVLVQLIRNLSPGQPPVLRIGGDSTDVSWVPAPGVRAPAYASYRLTQSWLATTAALARALHSRMIMGLNLAANEPALAAAEARSFRRRLGRRLSAFEIGNEPNVYGKIALFQVGPDRFVKARSRSFGYQGYVHQFDALAAVAPGRSLAGPTLAVGPKADPGSWVQHWGAFLDRESRVKLFTLHRYPLRNCYVGPGSRQYPTVRHLLSNYATVTLAAGLRRWISIGHSHHRLVRLDELNSAACRGKPGVSDTFSSALWVTDALFSLLQAGVDGVNMHTLPRSAYELFHFSHSADRWQAYVQPVYYGLDLFAQAAPDGARLLGVTARRQASGLRVWATRAPDGTVRVVLINKHPHRNRTVSLTMPAGSSLTAEVERLRAPSVSSQTGVTLGGRSYGSMTTTGELAAPHDQTLTAQGGAYTLSIPAGSAALVTFSP